jgi:hypothetical protein
MLEAIVEHRLYSGDLSILDHDLGLREPILVIDLHRLLRLIGDNPSGLKRREVGGEPTRILSGKGVHVILRMIEGARIHGLRFEDDHVEKN